MTNKPTVLVFDDDELIGQTIINLGVYSQLDVTYTSSAEQFWRLLQINQPDFIILDLLMPHCDGVQVVSQLAEKQIQSNLIITSGVANRVLEAAARSAKAQKLNVVGILQKPFSPKQFRNLIEIPTDKKKPDTVTKKNRYNANRSPQKKVDVTKRLRQALRNDELYFALQPKLDCRTSQLKGFEVLARWHDPELGNVGPDIFIAVAEKNNLIDILTINICKKAIEWFSDFINSNTDSIGINLQELSLAINISAVSLVNEGILNDIENLCLRYGVKPQLITIELTESAAMNEPIRTLDMLTRLRMKGFNLSIDDFGTGYSSMLQLVRLPFSELKIDKSFMLSALDSRESKIVIKATIELAHSLGLTVVAEGVENEEVFSYIRKLGCNEAQGYLISRPLEPLQILDWLRGRYIEKEQKRLSVLKSYNVIDTPSEYRYDRLTRLASRLFKLPTSVVSLIDEDRQWFKSSIGTSLKETPRSDAFCSHTIQNQRVLIVNDTLEDPRFADNPLVLKDPFIRFYAGYPIYSPEGEVFGAFCVMDIQPRQFTQHDVEMLQELSAMVETEIAMTNELTEDFLTGLLNRKTFESRAFELIKFCQKESLSLSMLYLDLDDFKLINDQYGHQMGDKILDLFAASLTQVFRDSDLIARLGGDEFVVGMVNSNSCKVDEILNRLHSVLSLDRVIDNLPEIHFSSGLAVSTIEHPLTLQQLYQEADIAMYNQKREKKKRLRN